MNRLLIIGPSHYCEKASWALDLARIDYELEGHPPFLHVMPVKRAGGTRQVPVLIADGKPIDGSDQIMAWIQAHPDTAWSPYGHAPAHHARIQALETEWGRKLGALTRLVAYYHLLPHKALILPSMSYATSERSLRTFARYYPIFRFLMRRAMSVNAANAASGTEALFDLFTQAEHDADGEFFVGDSLTAADITFAALSAPLVLPSAYGAPMPELEELPETPRDMVRRFRDTPSGQRVLRLYESWRNSKKSTSKYHNIGK